MRRYLLTSQRFPGHIELLYNTSGQLVRVDMLQTELTIEQLQRIFQVMPFNRADFSLLPKSVTCVEVAMEVTFEMYWLPCRKKVNRLRVEKEWAKISTEEKMLAVMAYKEYTRACDRTGRKELDPENYLRGKSWQTDWKGVY